MTLNKYISNKRLSNESFEQYKVRRCSANFHIKDLLSGKQVWDSSNKRTLRKVK